WIEEQSKDTKFQKGKKRAKILKNSSVRSLEGRNQVGDGNEQSVDRRVDPPCSSRSPKVTDHEDAECQDRKVMKVTKGWLAEWFGEPDLLRQVANVVLAALVERQVLELWFLIDGQWVLG
ncbi:hypothetical protein MTR67_002440, partial [Solanum verrucosum]